MGRKNRKEKTSPDNRAKPLNQYDVRENLKKLRSGNGTEPYHTNSQFDDKEQDNYYSSTGNQAIDFITKSHDRFDKMKDSVNSEISGIKDNIFSFKESTNNQLSSKLDISKFNWWLFGLISGFVTVIGTLWTLFFNLSYDDVTKSVKELNETKILHDQRIINLETNKPKVVEDTVHVIKK